MPSFSLLALLACAPDAPPVPETGERGLPDTADTGAIDTAADTGDDTAAPDTAGDTGVDTADPPAVLHDVGEAWAVVVGTDATPLYAAWPIRQDGAPSGLLVRSDEGLLVTDWPTGGVVPLPESPTAWVRSDRTLVRGAGGDLDGDGADDQVFWYSDTYWEDDWGDAYQLQDTTLLYTGPLQGEEIPDLTHVSDWYWNAHYAVEIAGDLDGDGLADLVVATEDASGAVFLQCVRPDGTTSPLATGRALAADLLSLGDTDGDGLDELAVARFGYGVSILEAPVTGSVDDAERQVPELGLTNSLHGTGDVDGDGYGDLLASSMPDGEIVVSVLAGATESTSIVAEIHLETTSTPSAVVVDLDGDGRDDVVGTGWSRGADAAAAFLGPLAGTFEEADADHAWTVTDGDGSRYDLLPAPTPDGSPGFALLAPADSLAGPGARGVFFFGGI